VQTYQLKWHERLLVALVALLLRALGATWRVREKGRKDLSPKAKPDPPVMFAFWHESILATAWHHRGCGSAVMISSSRDGELIAQLSLRLGYRPVRGSSTRGGREAAQELIETLKNGGNCAITPDGPRGPRRKVQPGVSKIPRQSGRSVVALGFAAEHCWRFKSWDRFMVPKPFSRCVFIYGEPVRMDPDKDASGDLVRVQTEMDRVMAEAEGFFKS
jgi:lysophospholipid acyltransferase (LPLAT)-like uncharacterized protein